MLVTERRFDVKLISADALAQYMTYRGESVRTLAAKVRCSRATIGHLRSGARDYVKPEWAAAIEKALDAPKGSLFVPVLSSVTREVAGRRRAA